MEIGVSDPHAFYVKARQSVSLVFRTLSVMMFLAIWAGPCGMSAGHLIAIALAVCYAPVVWDECSRTAWRCFMPLACLTAIDHAMDMLHGYHNLGARRPDIPALVMFAGPLTVLVVMTVVAWIPRTTRRISRAAQT